MLREEVQMRGKIVSGITSTLVLLSMLTLAFNIPPVKASGTIYIRADGSVDPPTVAITTVDNVTYTFTDSIYDSIVVERDNIIIDGAGYTLQGTGSGNGIDLSQRNNVTVKSMQIKSFEVGIRVYKSLNTKILGNNIEANKHYGIYLSQSSNNTIAENNVTATSGFANTKGIRLFQSSNNHIANNTLAKNGGGIELEGSSYNAISANNVTDSYGIGIRLGYSSNYNKIIENNISNAAGIELVYSSYSTIIANSLKNNSWGLLLGGSRQNTLRDNEIVGSRSYSFGIFPALGDFPLLSHYIHDIDASNKINGKPVYYLANQKGGIIDSLDVGYLAVINSTNVHIKNVNLTNNGQGILLAFTTNSTIENATITHNNVGIQVIYSDTNTITKSTIANAFGINLFRASSNVITENTITGSGGYIYGGILIGRMVYIASVMWTTFKIISEDNIISNNIISNNGNGLVLSNIGTNRTIIIDNTISKNTDSGICTEWGASNNKIYHNSFTDNLKNIAIDSTHGAVVNTWDDGYPFGGNYWSVYTGADEKSGSNQDLLGSDGLGDTPYVIDASNQDRYPLMKPYGGPHDIGITSLKTSKPVIGLGYSTTINVKIINYGISTEYFNVAVYANTTTIATFTNLSLTSRNSTTLAYSWDTTGIPYGTYTLETVITPAPDETDLTDNSLNCTVKVTIPGDINGDFYVNVTDAAQMSFYWQKRVPPAPPEVDIIDDGIINIKDAALIGVNWQKHA
jgi:parallel beta-helix repeat protein